MCVSPSRDWNRRTSRQTGYSLKSVERYLKDYERVKLLLKRGLDVAEISAMIDRGQHVVLEYVEIACQYHPELFAEGDGRDGQEG